jgi:cytoskeletal protein RodZ
VSALPVGDRESAPLGVGPYLLRERQRAELELEDVAAATKIPRRVLERLEKGELAELGAPVFVRGFVKAYARFLRIDVEEALAELERTLAARIRAAKLPEPPPQLAGERAVSLHPRARLGMALLVVVIVLLVVASRWIGP